MKDVSVIIVNYNTLRITQDCIDSIVENTVGVSYEIIVVDNASTDGSKDVLCKDRRIKYFYSERNGGFGYGNNVGMRNARGKYIFLLNSDTLLKNNAIKIFFDYSEENTPNTVYGCYLEGEDGSYRNSFFYFPAFSIGGFIRRIIHRPSYIPDYTNREVECICGADMFIPKSVVERVGNFDENIFLYGEEGEWQYRMAMSGVKRMLINTPKIVHLEGKSIADSPEKTALKLQSHFYVLRKYMNLPTYFMAWVYYYIWPRLKWW